MKKLYLILLVFVSFQLYAQNLISYEYLEDYTVGELNQFLQDAGAPNGIVTLEYDVEVYKVVYNTTDRDGVSPTIASGAVVLPKGYFCQLPLASYQHGTTSHDDAVPSRNSYELRIGMLFASKGYVVSAPDYLGLGDNAGMHPYQHSDTEASATIDLLRAVKEMAPLVNRTLRDELYLFGYSQGGHATMAAFKEIEANFSDEFTLKATAPMSGAYDMSGAQTDMMDSDEPYATPGYLPFLLLGYQDVYGNIFNEFSDIFKEPYATELPPLFDGSHDIGYINQQCDPVVKNMFTAAQYADFQTNPNHPFKVAIAANDLLDFAPQSPVHLIYCSGDEQVNYLNSENAYTAYTNNGSTSVTKKDFGPFSHSDCILFALLETLNFFQENGSPVKEVLADVDINHPSSSAAADGEVILTPSADANNLSYTWSNGQTSAAASNLSPGIHSVTVTDTDGCEIYLSFELFDLTPTEEHLLEEARVFPNPTEGVLNISLPSFEGSIAAQVMDISGKLILETSLDDIDNQIDLQSLTKGIYYLRLSSTKATTTKAIYVN